ncbi:Inosine-5'-monophosphate dehydrogenase [subsurface metagenome]
MLGSSKQNYLVVLDEQNRLVKLAFTKDVEKIKVASAISTYEGWEKRVKANIKAGVDLIVLDTSDAFNYYAIDVIKKYKKMGVDVPLCVGNVIDYDGTRRLMEEGADIIKIGMSAGSICTTGKEKAVGRAPMSALIDANKARNDYFNDTGRYVPLIIDGGVANPYDMVITLTIADAIMTGNYLNRFYEAAGEKLDEKGNITTIEQDMKRVFTYGEGSERVQNLPRYGHTKQTTFFPEGEEGTVEYRGRLKPTLKADLLRVKAALVNTGCMNLEEFRRNAVIEVMSDYARGIVGETHHMKVKS